MKTTMNTILWMAATLLVASCGGAGANGHEGEGDGEHHGGGEGHHGEHHGGGEHGDLPAGLHAFHEAFAPIWHADAGEARTRRACEAAPELASLAVAAEQDAAPGSQPTLAAAIGSLQSACDGGDATATEQALTTAHDALHAIMEGL